MGRAHRRAQSTVGFCGEGQGPPPRPCFYIRLGSAQPFLRAQTVLRDSPAHLPYRTPAFLQAVLTQSVLGPWPAECGVGPWESCEPSSLSLPGQREGGDLRQDRRRGKGVSGGSRGRSGSRLGEPGRGLLATAGGVGGVEAGDHTERQGLTPQSSPGAQGRMGRTSCYCKWAGGFLFPRRVRLASASPDKGASSWPAVSPPDHRVLGGAWGARLWLWGQQTGGGVEIPRQRRAGTAECTGDPGGALAAGDRGRSESWGWGVGSQGRPRNLGPE